jgi:ATP-binding cassette subfamily B protein RaxB
VFRYAPTERPTLDGVNLHIQAGEFVAIAGDSGQGKTTLLKVLLGLYPHDSGDIVVDSRLLSELGLSTLRRQVGVVMQEDQLLTGTIAENIALFDHPHDIARIRRCAQQAHIDDEIMALPMQYHTLVGDLGTSLSAGQRQRVLLARALHRNPAVLVLDECTAHVGAERERKIIDMLRGLRMTRVVVSHSPAMLAAADRAVWLRNGRLVADAAVDTRLTRAAL